MNEVARLAVECVEAVLSGAPAVVKKSFRARARHLHSDLYYHGPAYVLALTSARSGGATGAGLSGSCRNMVNAVLSQRLDPEDAAYALYGGMLLVALRQFGVVRASVLQDAVKELLEPDRAALATSVVRPFAEWVRRMAETLL